MAKSKICVRPLRIFKNKKGGRYIIYRGKKYTLNNQVSDKDLLKFVLKRVLVRKRGRRKLRKIPNPNLIASSAPVATGASNLEISQLKKDAEKLQKELTESNKKLHLK